MTRVAILTFVFVACMRIAHADGPDPEQRYIEGQAAFDRGQYDAAIAAWQESFDLSHQPGLLFNLAQAYRLRARPGDCALAAATYTQFIAQDQSSTQLPLAARFLAETTTCAAREAAAREPPPHEPPPHQPPPPKRAFGVKRIAGISSAAVGAALVVAGVYEGHEASKLGNEVTADCTGGCNYPQFAPLEVEGRRDQTRQWIFYGAGTAAIAGGIALFWWGSHDETTPISIAMTPHVGGAIATWSGLW